MESTQVTLEHLGRWLRAPEATDHKYSRGVVEFHTGSRAFPGAALLGVLGALRTGVGMVCYLGPPSVTSHVIHAHPEAVVAPGKVDSVVVGSGIAVPLGSRSIVRVREAFSRQVPTVVDAGALDLVEEHPPVCVLTPHAGELTRVHHRVLGRDMPSELEAAKRLAGELAVTILLKGSLTHVVDGSRNHWQLPLATPWLATAGTGDVLAGILGAMLASSREQLETSPQNLGEIVAAGALLHAISAESASRSRHGGPITSTDVAEAIPGEVGKILSSKP